MLRFRGAKNTLSFATEHVRIPDMPTLIEPAMQMNLVSLNVGLPREVIWHGMEVTTGIFKQPVESRVAPAAFGYPAGQA